MPLNILPFTSLGVWLIIVMIPLGERAVPSNQATRTGNPTMNAVTPPSLTVHATEDFAVTGDGSHPAWEAASWVSLSPLGAPFAGDQHGYASRVKMLYSERGIYVLFDGKDEVLTDSLRGLNQKLWEEDVFEFFFWTDERYPLYFEYEISPLGEELPLIIPNFDGEFFGWVPWQYEGERVTQKAVSIAGGAQTTGAAIEGWRAEVFVPYELFVPLQNVPPRSGSQWRANFYRVDYDHEKTTHWSWAPVSENFHQFALFGTIHFE